MVATGNSGLVTVDHLLSDPDARLWDLGADHYDSRIDKQPRAPNLAWQLQALTGQRILVRNSQVVIVEPTQAA